MANDSYRHKAATRRNNPTPETESLMTDEDRKPKPFTIDRHEIATPVLAWQREGETSALTGDAAEDTLLRMEALPLYVREKIAPSEFVNQLRKPDSGIQLSTDDFNGLPEGADPLNFYEHSGNWQNRLIHGDSADVMKSLIAKDGLAGQVQMIYYDPPYGMSYQSNFQPTTDNLDVKDNDSAVPAGRRAAHPGVPGHVPQRRPLVPRRHPQAVRARTRTAGRQRVAVRPDRRRERSPARRAVGRGIRRRQPRCNDHLATHRHAVSQTARRERQLHPLVRQGQRADQVQPDLRTPRPAGTDGRLHVVRRRYRNSGSAGSEANSKDEREDVALLPEGARLFKRSRLTSQGLLDHRQIRRLLVQRQMALDGADEPMASLSASSATACAGPRADDEPCPGDPDGTPGRVRNVLLSSVRVGYPTLGTTLHWKLFEEERPGRKVDNVWHSVAAPSKKRYVVQTADSIVERCLLMTTDPGDLVLDPTCGSGVTADLAEEWGRRWITCDAQRVAVASRAIPPALAGVHVAQDRRRWAPTQHLASSRRQFPMSRLSHACLRHG